MSSRPAMPIYSTPLLPKLDRREEHFRIASPVSGLTLFLRLLSPMAPNAASSSKIVLYVHGGSFPSALSIAHRFDGRSWRDELVDAGFHVWGLDFQGFGASDHYPQMNEAADSNPVLGRAEEASQQLERAVRFIREHHGVRAISIIAHSWGTIAAGELAGRCPDMIDRLVFFGPIARREKKAEPQTYQAWRLVSLQDQWSRFTSEVPAEEAPVLSERHFAEWGQRYLDTDPQSRQRLPASVKIPSGPWADIAAAGAGDLGYDPGLIRAPVAIIRGEWDSLATDLDAHWLFSAFKASPVKRDVKISRATHLMHLETMRLALWRESVTFLLDGTAAGL